MLTISLFVWWQYRFDTKIFDDSSMTIFIKKFFLIGVSHGVPVVTCPRGHKQAMCAWAQYVGSPTTVSARWRRRPSEGTCGLTCTGVAAVDREATAVGRMRGWRRCYRMSGGSWWATRGASDDRLCKGNARRRGKVVTKGGMRRLWEAKHMVGQP